jgi:hypothetical protein
MSTHIFKPAVRLDLPVFHLAPNATVYEWQEGAMERKYLVVTSAGRETWTNVIAWAVKMANEAKPPQLSLFP